MRISSLTLLFVLVLALPSCGRTGGEDRVEESAARTPVDSLRKQPPRDRLVKVLDNVRESMKASKDTVDADRLVNASYATVKVLTTLARAWDGEGSWAKAIDAREAAFQKEDVTRSGQSGRIINGMLGIRDMFEVLYSMRYAGRDTAMKLLDDMNTRIKGMMNDRADGATLLGQLGDDCYHLARNIFIDLDHERVFAGHFEQIDQVYAEGLGAAESGEDRFLNGIYRTFEVCQIWAVSLDVRKRAEVQQLYGAMIKRTSAREGIGHQMATATEFLYRITDYIVQAILAAGR